MQLWLLLLWQNKATRKCCSSILEHQKVFELLLSPRKINGLLSRLPVKRKTMCQFCQPCRGFVTKLFTLPLEWPDQTFISVLAGGKTALHQQMLEWLATTLEVLRAKPSFSRAFCIYSQTFSHLERKLLNVFCYRISYRLNRWIQFPRVNICLLAGRFKPLLHTVYARKATVLSVNMPKTIQPVVECSMPKQLITLELNQYAIK